MLADYSPFVNMFTTIIFAIIISFSVCYLQGDAPLFHELIFYSYGGTGV